MTAFNRSVAAQAPAPLRRLGLITLMAATILVAFAALSQAMALTLSDAKSQGLIGEMATGYVGYPSAPSAAVKQLGDGVNLGRKSHYADIAAKEGTSLTVVEQLAGKKLIEQAPAGTYVNDGSGWRRK